MKNSNRRLIRVRGNSFALCDLRTLDLLSLPKLERARCIGSGLPFFLTTANILQNPYMNLRNAALGSMTLSELS